MSKFLHIEIDSGREYIVSLHYIADNRAKYYAEKDKDATYQEEYDYVMNDTYEAIDWFTSNMNPEDIPENAYQVHKEVPKRTVFDDMEYVVQYKIVELK